MAPTTGPFSTSIARANAMTAEGAISWLEGLKISGYKLVHTECHPRLRSHEKPRNPCLAGLWSGRDYVGDIDDLIRCIRGQDPVILAHMDADEAHHAAAEVVVVFEKENGARTSMACMEYMLGECNPYVYGQPYLVGQSRVAVLITTFARG